MLKFLYQTTQTPPDKATCTEFNHLISWFFLSVSVFLRFFDRSVLTALQALVSGRSFSQFLFTHFVFVLCAISSAKPSYILVLSLCFCLPPSYCVLCAICSASPHILWFFLSVSVFLLRICLVGNLQCKAVLSLGSFSLPLFLSFSLIFSLSLFSSFLYVLCAICSAKPSYLCFSSSLLYLSCARSAMQNPRISWFFLSVSVFLLHICVLCAICSASGS